MGEPAVYLPTQYRRLSRILRAERRVAAATTKALEELAEIVGTQLTADGYTAVVVDNRAPEWRAALVEKIMPVIREVYEQGFYSEHRGEAVTAAAEPSIEGFYTGDGGPADRYAAHYLQQVENRLVDVSDDVFRAITAALEEGRQATFQVTLDGVTTTEVGESITQLAARVEALLGDGQRWKNRGTLVARTEVIAANNAGSHDAAYDNAKLFGTESGQVVKEWLATSDTRTRPSHQEANHQQVLGLGAAFSVGGSQMQVPGDPAAPADERCNCRCTALYHYPGDPDYPDSAALVAAAAPMEDPMTEQTPEDDDRTGVVVVALPSADSPVRGIGEEDKHTTILWFGDADDNETLTDEFRTELSAFVAQIADTTAPFTEGVAGVESLGDDCARVWMLDGTDLPAVRDALLDYDDVQVPWQAVEQYPTYVPHTTIGYPDADPVDGVCAALDQSIEDAAAEVTSITYDRLAVWWAGEQTEWTLNGEAAMTAAGDYDWAAAIVGARLAGASYAELADQFGYTSAGAARKAVMRALEAAESPAEPPVVPESTLTAADAPEPRAPLLPEDMPVPEGAPALAQDIPEDGRPFYGIIAPEGIPSDDGREFGVESMLARDLPLPLMFQDAQEAGHDGAVRVGRIDKVWRDTDTYAVPMIRYTGVWDVSDAADEAHRQVEAGVAKGVSVDGVAVTTRFVDADGNELDPMSEEIPDVVIEHADEVKMAGLTVCSVPAFEQTYIANGVIEDRDDPEPGQTPRAPLPSGGAETPTDDAPVVVEEDETEALVASAPAWTIGLVASANGEGDWVVPAAHFTDPGLTEPTALTVDGDGRVYGHLATWGQCHIGQAAGRRGDQVRAAGKCMEVPQSASGYAYFATGVVHTDDGQVVNVGQLTMDTGHANLQLGAKQTVDHYDNTGAPVADIVVGQDTVGIWFSGHVRPTATPAQVYAMTASGSVSGDWREVVRRSNQLELVAALVVNVPGFPIGRPAVTASASGPVALVASGAITPPQKPQEAVYATEGLLEDRALVASLTREVMAGIARTQRAQAAARRIRTHRATKAAARIAKGA